MNESALHQDRFEAIEAYLLGKLSADAQDRFEQDMAHDALLRREVEVQRENMLAVEMGGLRQAVRSVMDQDRSMARRHTITWSDYLKYAAAIALVLAVAVWWLARPNMNERLFAQHHVTDPGMPVPMSLPAQGYGLASDAAFLDAMVSFKMGEYARAHADWTAMLERIPSNDTLRYYVAAAAMEQDLVQDAAPLFAAVASGHSAFAQRARWSLFLIYVRTDDTAARLALGMEHDPVYGERVRAINERLSP